MSRSMLVVTDVFTHPGMLSSVRKQTAVATVTRMENTMMARERVDKYVF